MTPVYTDQARGGDPAVIAARTAAVGPKFDLSTNISYCPLSKQSYPPLEGFGIISENTIQYATLC